MEGENALDASEQMDLYSAGLQKPCRGCGTHVEVREPSAQAWCDDCGAVQSERSAVLARAADIIRRAGTEDAERVIADLERMVEQTAPRACGACFVHPCRCEGGV